MASLHISSMRATSRATPGFSASMRAPISGSEASMFMPKVLRRSANPECISAQRLRARARWRRSRGHSAFSGCRSARYSAMARESQTAKPSSTRSGTRPVGAIVRKVFLKSEPSSQSRRRRRSSKAMPLCRISSQARSDHEE
jgi:hypothetical protein